MGIRVVARLGRFAALAFALTLAPVHADTGFSPAQRDEIVRILRDALRQDPSILREALENLQADDAAQEARASEAAIAANRARLVTESDPVLGNPEADVTVVEFFDVRCPYCRQMEPAMASLLARDKKLRIIYKDLPILGPASVAASRALLAAQMQGKYEALRVALMTAKGATTAETIAASASALGLDVPKLEQDAAGEAVSARIAANTALAQDLKIHATPAIIVGGTLLNGAVSEDELATAIAAARRGKG
jgi:protein-disulfide isomerase